MIEQMLLISGLRGFECNAIQIVQSSIMKRMCSQWTLRVIRLLFNSAGALYIKIQKKTTTSCFLDIFLSKIKKSTTTIVLLNQ